MLDYLDSLISMLLNPKTQFKIKRVYGYTTLPGFPLLAAQQQYSNSKLVIEESKFESYEEQLNIFYEKIERVLRRTGASDNKIAVELEYQYEKPGLFGHIGTIYWCQKDQQIGFYFSCRPQGNYIRWIDTKFSLSDE